MTNLEGSQYLVKTQSHSYQGGLKNQGQLTLVHTRAASGSFVVQLRLDRSTPESQMQSGRLRATQHCPRETQVCIFLGV